MPATVATFQPNPFETARAKLIEALQGLPVPRRISAYHPSPEDFGDVSEHLKQATALFDLWLSAIGYEVAQNATCKVNTDLFNDVISDAVVGWATAECDRAEVCLRADLEEMAS